MLEFTSAVQSYVQSYMQAVATNPVLAAILLPIVGVLTYSAKSIPRSLFNLVWRRVTVTMTMNNTTVTGNSDAFQAFDRWFMGTRSINNSRSFFLLRQYEYQLAKGQVYVPYRLGIGPGFHLFSYKKKLYWLYKRSLESTGSENQKEEIVVTTFGFSLNAFSELVDIFNAQEREDTDVYIWRYEYKERNWSRVTKQVPREINTVALDPKVKDDVVSKIEKFTANKSLYRRKGLTYKLSFIFYGPPGTGKTVFSRALSTHFNKDLFELDLSSLTDSTMLDALSKVKPGSILLIEDIDAAGNSVKSREAKEGDDKFSFLTLKGVLNSLDGIIGLDNVILIATTNHLDHLDSALTRTSRFDFKYEFQYMNKDRIIEYGNLMFETDLWALPRTRDLCAYGELPLLPGSDVECLYKQHHESAEDFVNAVLAEIEHPTLRVHKVPRVYALSNNNYAGDVVA